MQSCFVFAVAKKFEIPTLDLKVYDDSKTEVDEEAFVFLLTQPNLGVLEVCFPQVPNSEGELRWSLGKGKLVKIEDQKLNMSLCAML